VEADIGHGRSAPLLTQSGRGTKKASAVQQGVVNSGNVEYLSPPGPTPA
jgi:hypothetical protein